LNNSLKANDEVKDGEIEQYDFVCVSIFGKKNDVNSN